MKILEIVRHKRLEKIRKELNCYIAENIEIKHCDTAAFIAGSAPQQLHTGGVMGKFFHAMKLSEDVSEFDFENEESLDYVENSASVFGGKREQKKSIDEILEQKAETFSTMLLRMIDEKGLKDSEVYKKANIDRRLFSKIRGDEEYLPSKKTAISFCLALQLEVEEAKKLLESAGYTLSKASRFDLIIMYLMEHKKYNIHFANIVLDNYGVGTLSK